MSRCFRAHLQPSPSIHFPARGAQTMYKGTLERSQLHYFRFSTPCIFFDLLYFFDPRDLQHVHRCDDLPRASVRCDRVLWSCTYRLRSTQLCGQSTTHWTASWSTLHDGVPAIHDANNQQCQDCPALSTRLLIGPSFCYFRIISSGRTFRMLYNFTLDACWCCNRSDALNFRICN